MATWTDCLLGDVIELKRGYDLPEREREAGRVPILSSSGRSGHHSRSKVRGPGVVTGRYGTLGEVFFVEEDFWPLNTALYVRDFKGNDPRFISYWLTQQRLGSQNSAGAVPGVNRNHLHQLVTRIPPLDTQRRIALILSAYDHLVENNTRRISILEEMAQRIYDEWFVHFRIPGREQLPLIDSPLGSIPVGWEVVKLGDVTNLKWGDTSKTKKSYVTEGFPAFSATGQDGKLPDWNFDRTGIVLSAIGAHCGRTWITRGKWSCIKNTIRFWADIPGLSNEYLYIATKKSSFWPRRGAAQPFISQGDARDCQLLIPSADIGNQFESVAAPIMMLGGILEAANRNLRAQRELLLPKLIAGEIGVLEVEDLLEAAE
ncbi:restriction endonuclease subunit S [Mesorhizobium sp. M0514]|uniref:restriction endonuclease subunit S n=1 Tax=Mesorhizobium sp. M0514 TaxID=2956955 RepID=UPI003334BADF